jgi:DNA processing protein
VASVDDNEINSWLRLTLLPGLGGASLRRLLSEFGAPDKVLAARHGELARFVTPDLASQNIEGGDAAAVARAHAWLGDPANHIVTLADAEYPQLLLQTGDPPCLLYVKGRRELLNQPAFAVVGSRNATAQGRANAEEFARALSNAGFTIVSGLALGIDAAAHRGGLAGAGSSMAVVGTGLDIIYPARNRDLALELAARGTLISEFPLGTAALGTNFPRRNRVISGMSRGCLVVEAALESGSLITARFANEQGREVFALPGSIHSPLAKGCHALIKQGAKLVDSASDILEELSLAPTARGAGVQGQRLDADAARVLESLGYEPSRIDALCARCAMPADAISAALLTLEIAGLVENLPGGLYQRMR